MRLSEDWVFRFVYGAGTEESNLALLELLNVVLNRSRDPIVEVRVENPVMQEGKLDSRQIIMDIRASSLSGELYNVEMQAHHFAYFRDRILFNGCRLMSKTLKKGEDYDKMKKTYVISFVNGTLFQEHSDIHSIYRLEKSDDCRLIMSDRMEFHFLELGKLDMSKEPEELTADESLAAFIRFAGDEEKREYLKRLHINHREAVEMSEKVFNAITEEQKAMIYEYSHTTWLHDQTSLMNEMRRQGVAEGIEQGGLEKICEAAKNVMESLQCGMDRALDILQVEPEERSRVIRKLEQENTGR